MDLKNCGTALTFDEYLEYNDKRSSLPPYSYVISFDDGFENNLTVAAPILRELGIPAIFYLTTDWVDRNRMAWVDRVELCFEKTECAKLHLPGFSERLDFWDVASKIRVLDQMRATIKGTAGLSINEIVNQVFIQCGQKAIQESSDPLDQKLTWDQVRQLARDPLFTVGAHTHTHPIMSFIPIEQCESEIERSLALLETHTGTRPHHFAYPDGQEHHFNQTVIDILADHGILACPTAIPGINPLGTNPFHLRRIMVV